MPTFSCFDAKTESDINASSYNFADPLAIGLLATRARFPSTNGTVSVSGFSGPFSTFLSRIGFFEYAGLRDPHQVLSRGGPRTLEIRPIEGNNERVYESLRALLGRDQSLPTIVKMVMELISNIEMHSGAEGLVVGQVVKGQIRLAFVDDGVGVHQTLTSNPQYADLREDQALVRCVEHGVGSGRGRGFGLWSAHEVIARNGGELLIGSGEYEFSLRAGSVRRTPRWAGTYVELRYNLNRFVNYSEVTGLANSLGVVADEDFTFV